jgi:hypothetical protein
MQYSDPKLYQYQLARRHRAHGLRQLQELRRLLTEHDQMRFSENDQANGASPSNGVVPGDIHGTSTFIERRLMPLLISAGQSYMAACWASNESHTPSVWPCENHKTPGYDPSHSDIMVGNQGCGECCRNTSEKERLG